MSALHTELQSIAPNASDDAVAIVYALRQIAAGNPGSLIMSQGIVVNYNSVTPGGILCSIPDGTGQILLVVVAGEIFINATSLYAGNSAVYATADFIPLLISGSSGDSNVTAYYLR